MTIAVTGASGQLAGAVAAGLLSVIDPAQVVLISRRPDQLARFAGADHREGDFSRPETLSAAFAGVTTLMLTSTDAVGVRLDQQRAAIAAAAAAGVERIIYTSIPRTESSNPAAVVPDHAGTEAALRESGLAWTFLRNNLYSHMQVPTVQQAAESGQLVTNAGAGRVAYVTREDCAAVAVSVLTQDGHAGQAYDVTGPAALAAVDLAGLAAEIRGSAVEVVEVDDAQWAAGLVSAGLPEGFAQLLASFGASAREGYLEDVTTVVPDLTGKPATSLRSVLGLN